MKNKKKEIKLIDIASLPLIICQKIFGDSVGFLIGITLTILCWFGFLGLILSSIAKMFMW